MYPSRCMHFHEKALFAQEEPVRINIEGVRMCFPWVVSYSQLFRPKGLVVMRWEERLFIAATQIFPMCTYQSVGLAFCRPSWHSMLHLSYNEKHGVFVWISRTVSVERALYQTLRGRGKYVCCFLRGYLICCGILQKKGLVFLCTRNL